MATVERLSYGPLLRVANAAVAAAERAGARIARLDADELLRDARRGAGLDDWGEEAFVERLRRLLAEARDAPLTPLARALVRGALLRALKNRLEVVAYVRRHPEVRDIPIERPLFILGFPRTGTTVLQHLLSLDEGHRALRFWELSRPVPVSRRPRLDRRLRRLQAQLAIGIGTVVAPEMHAIHHISADTAEECWPLFYNSVAAMNFDLGSGFSDFGDWLVGQDMREPYRFYRLQLQVLAHQRPTRRFVLKCPEHLWFTDAILDVFPDAAIVWTHRDPARSVPSYCSLISLNRRMLYGRIDPEPIGRHITRRFVEAVERATRVRGERGDAAFFDADFREIVRDPLAVAHAIRRRFGIPDPPEVHARMERWLAEERPDARGQHRYSAEQWGLDPAAVRRRFQPYLDRFGLPGGRGAAGDEAPPPR